MFSHQEVQGTRATSQKKKSQICLASVPEGAPMVSQKKPADISPSPIPASPTVEAANVYTSRTVLVLDNGGFHIKAMLIRPDQPVRVAVVPNCVGAASYAGRGIVGGQLYALPHYHGFMVRRPTDRGYIVDGLLEAHVWECVMQQLGIEDERDVELLLTMPFAAPKSVANLLHVLVTERFHFAAITIVSSHYLALLARTLCPSLDDTRHPGKSRNQEKGERGTPSREKDTAQVSPPRRKRGRELGASASPDAPHAAEEEEPVVAATPAELTGTAVIVDAGFSTTTIVPYIDGLPVYSSIVRLSVGGKLMTNRLKEHLSFAQVNVLEDGWLVNHVRERCCYVASAAEDTIPSLHERLAACRPAKTSRVPATTALTEVPTVRYYLPTIPALLPLGCTEEELSSRVRLRHATATVSSADAPITGGGGVTVVEASSLQHVRLRQEAFLIPELLFCPGDVGLQEMGLVQAVTHGIFDRGLLKHLPLLRETLLRSVCVFGGVAATPGFVTRLQAELNAARRSGALCCSRGTVVGDGDMADLLVQDTATLPAVLRVVSAVPSASSSSSSLLATPHQSKSSAMLTPAEVVPLVGAFYLLTPNSTQVSAVLGRRRAAVQQLLCDRSRVVLHGAAKRLSAEDIYTVLQRLL